MMTLTAEDYTLDELIQKLGRDKSKESDKLAKAIQSAIHGSYRLSLLQSDSVNIVFGLLAREIQSLEKMIKEIDRVIEDMVEVLPEYQCLTSVPGIGKVFVAGIIAEFGQI